MNLFLSLLAAASISGLLMQLLYVIIVIAIIACVIWIVNTYITPIPQPILMIIGVIIIILSAVYLLRGFGM